MLFLMFLKHPCTLCFLHFKVKNVTAMKQQPIVSPYSIIVIESYCCVKNENRRSYVIFLKKPLNIFFKLIVYGQTPKIKVLTWIISMLCGGGCIGNSRYAKKVTAFIAIYLFIYLFIYTAGAVLQWFTKEKYNIHLNNKYIIYAMFYLLF
jgi:hypothetical protein